MGCTHNHFDHEDPIHYAELHLCPLSGAFPACQYTQYHRDEHEEDCKQNRKEDIQEEVGDSAWEVANPIKDHQDALIRQKCGREM